MKVVIVHPSPLPTFHILSKFRHLFIHDLKGWVRVTTWFFVNNDLFIPFLYGPMIVYSISGLLLIPHMMWLLFLFLVIPRRESSCHWESKSYQIQKERTYLPLRLNESPAPSNPFGFIHKQLDGSSDNVAIWLVNVLRSPESVHNALAYSIHPLVW